jgi:hypothetical protein
LFRACLGKIVCCSVSRHEYSLKASVREISARTAEGPVAVSKTQFCIVTF